MKNPKHFGQPNKIFLLFIESFYNQRVNIENRVIETYGTVIIFFFCLKNVAAGKLGPPLKFYILGFCIPDHLRKRKMMAEEDEPNIKIHILTKYDDITLNSQRLSNFIG